MANLQNYNKLVFKDADGNLQIIQPKSYTKPSQGEKDELIGLLMNGEYVITLVAMPIATYQLKKKEG